MSGAPEKDQNHAEKVCDMALDMIEAITDLKDPSTGQHLKIRVGVHSGAVVAGIVGLKMPRYSIQLGFRTTNDPNEILFLSQVLLVWRFR